MTEQYRCTKGQVDRRHLVLKANKPQNRHLELQSDQQSYDMQTSGNVLKGRIVSAAWRKQISIGRKNLSGVYASTIRHNSI
jgi:hypothetical protein